MRESTYIHFNNGSIGDRHLHQILVSNIFTNKRSMNLSCQYSTGKAILEKLCDYIYWTVGLKNMRKLEALEIE